MYVFKKFQVLTSLNKVFSTSSSKNFTLEFLTRMCVCGCECRSIRCYQVVRVFDKFCIYKTMNLKSKDLLSKQVGFY